MALQQLIGSTTLGVLVGCLIPIGFLAATNDRASAEPAIGQFELKGLEAEPGEVEFQSQNAVSWGQPGRRVTSDGSGGFLYDDNEAARQRHALEIEMSLTHYWRMRVGIEYEKERFDEPASPAQADTFDALKLTEVGLETVLILKHVQENSLGFGLLVEFEHPTEPDGMNNVVMGAIIGTRSGAWSALVNLTLDHQFGAGERGGDDPPDDKWDFVYAAQLKYQMDPAWALAFEAYGTIDRIGDTGTPSEANLVFGDYDQHRAGPVVYYAWKRGSGAAGGNVAALEDDAKAGGEDGHDDVTVTLGTGLLFGLNDNTPAATLKASLEVDF